jgi:hypothetical protein
MAVTWKKLCYEEDAVLKTDFTAKGDLLSASAASTPLILAAGANDLVLTLDDGEATGMKWAATGAGDFLADGSVPMTGDLDFDDNEAKDMIIQQVADEAAVAAYATPVVGKLLFATSELTAWICTVAA